MFTLKLRKENFKFSGSHFTIFGPESAERLHGHNFQVAVSLGLKSLSSDLGMAFDFNLVKPMIRRACDFLDEYVLIPEKSPYLKIAKKDDEIEVRFYKKRYVFPKEDVRLLPVANVTSEELARFIADKIMPELPTEVLSLSVSVRETAGQSVTYVSSSL